MPCRIRRKCGRLHTCPGAGPCGRCALHAAGASGRRAFFVLFALFVLFVLFAAFLLFAFFFAFFFAFLFFGFFLSSCFFCWRRR